MTGPRESGAPLPDRSRSAVPDADDGRASRAEGHRESDDERAAAAPAGATQGGVPESAGPDALEAADDLIPADVELAAGTIPTNLFEAVEDSSERPSPRAMAQSGGSTAGRRSRSADLAGALLGSGSSAEEVPDALRDTVAAIEELFPGTLLASAPREDTDTDAESEPDPGADEAAAGATDEPRVGEDPRDGAGAGLFGGDGAQSPRDDGSRAGEHTTSDRSEAG